MFKESDFVYYLSWIFICLKLTHCETSSAFISAGANRVPIKLTWKSTGSCPPLPRDKVCEWIASPSFIRNLALIASLPDRGIEFLRVHWLLSAVEGPSTTSPQFNFTCLDIYFGLLRRFDLSPIFEVMGNPSGLFDDFDDGAQVSLWGSLVSSLASRYLRTFGPDYLKSWIFETWNEPKAKNFESIRTTPQGFLNYYDATAEGLKRVHPGLRLAAPGGGCTARHDPRNYCWLLLDHIQSGGGRVIVPDLISIHVKGVFPNSSTVILDGEEAFRRELDEHLPAFKGTGIINDESDPEVSWNISRTWQADSSYAVLVVKIIQSHLCLPAINDNNKNNNNNNDDNDDPIVSLLSNDNAFLSYHPHPFEQRTLTARFQVNETDHPHIRLVRKPAYSVLGLLSQLGERMVGDCSSDDSFGWIATSHDDDDGGSEESRCWYLSVVMTRFQLDSASRENRSVHLRDIPVDVHPGMRYSVRYMDDLVSNPYGVWVRAGSPQTPTDVLFDKMRRQEEPSLLHPPTDWTQGSSGNITLEMAPASIALFQLCADTCGGPGQVIDVRGLNVTFNLLFIFWSDSEVRTKCLSTYEVEHSRDGVDYRRINPEPILFNSFEFSGGGGGGGDETSDRQENVLGYYRIRAVDFWNNLGKYSVPYKYPSTF